MNLKLMSTICALVITLGCSKKEPIMPQMDWYLEESAAIHHPYFVGTDPARIVDEDLLPDQNGNYHADVIHHNGKVLWIAPGHKTNFRVTPDTRLMSSDLRALATQELHTDQRLRFQLAWENYWHELNEYRFQQ